MLIVKWAEVRENHPKKWILFEAIDVYSDDGQRFINELSIINIFDNGRDALKEYSELHKKDKNREMYVYNTKNKELKIEERNWVGVRLHG